MLAFACLAGCSNSNKPAVTSTRSTKTEGRLYAVAVESTAFFRHGPRALDPDQKLPRETLVRLIRPSFGYSKVEVVATKEQGYVASEDIQPATAALVAAASAPKVDPMTMATPTDTPPTPSVEQFHLNSDDPRLVPPPEDLPPSELPAADPHE